MLFFALFTVGFFVGVIMTLVLFPPQTKEIEEQEVNALSPILQMENKKLLGKSDNFDPATLRI
jgi:uncharacterized membrane protein YgaE (UPF0421/DUF939 family)